MTLSFPLPVAIDLLTQAADYVRPHLDRSKPVGERPTGILGCRSCCTRFRRW
jgi:hypothetical protein